MDLKDFELVSGAVFFQLRNPQTDVLLEDGNGPVGVKILGSDSPEFKRHKRQLVNRNLERQSKRKGSLTAEEIEDTTEKTLAACIVEIVNLSHDGKPLKAPDDCLHLIKEMPWAADQIDEAIGNRSLFMKVSQSS